MDPKSFIYGLWPVIEALKAGKEIDKILIQKGLRGEGFHQLFSFIKDLGIPSQFVPPEKLQRITRQNHQGVIAYISEITYQKLENIVPYVYEQGKVPLVLVLDRITDVRNFGAIARTAECAGVDALVIPAKNSVSVSPDAIKTSAGALYKLSVCRSASLADSLHYLKNSGLKIVAATEKTETGYTKTEFDKPLALVIGSEEDGISEELLNIADEKVKIPVLGEIASLNVSVATGIILYEIIRQRKQD